MLEHPEPGVHVLTVGCTGPEIYGIMMHITKCVYTFSNRNTFTWG